ncbi:ribosomal protein S18 acetylase RimI-like enzyme [Anaerotaenia torta]|uniref:GNAT family N-acetyltransferase n=1 Tax=Anaerotaenia torta TaxID=433293 RepID=UPI003D1964D2
MQITYRNATIDDIDFLVESRLDFIHRTPADESYEFIKSNLYSYFEQGFKENQCDIVLAEANSSVVGTGIIFYYNSVPSSFNPWGKNAYITSIFVNEKYRRQGIASIILDKLIKAAMLKEYHVFLLQETDVGRPLYEKYGFHEGKKGMILKL